MRAVLQRVSQASVEVKGRTISRIGPGMLLLLAVEKDDLEEDIEWICSRILRVRIFDDTHGVMNLSVGDAGGEILAVSQFTLMGTMKKGSRPSYNRAAGSEEGKIRFDQAVEFLRRGLGKAVPTGEFGADMKVALVNDGPVTLILDSQRRDF